MIRGLVRARRSRTCSACAETPSESASTMAHRDGATAGRPT
jgi:hypothetical protein